MAYIPWWQRMSPPTFAERFDLGGLAGRTLGSRNRPKRTRFRDGLGVMTFDPRFSIKDPTDTESFKPLDAPIGALPILSGTAIIKRVYDTFFKKKDKDKEKKKKKPDEDPTILKKPDPLDPKELDKLLESIKLANEVRKHLKEKRIPVKGEKGIRIVEGGLFEVRLTRGGENFEERFKKLKDAKAYRDEIAKLPIETGQHMKGKIGPEAQRFGKYVEEGGAQNIREILTDFIAQGKPTYTTEDVLNLVDTSLFGNDVSLKQTLSDVKKEPAFKDLEFISGTGNLVEFSDEVIQLVKDNYGKLTNENMAKLIFPDISKTVAVSRIKRILGNLEA